jgi:hypothetical protein
MLLSLATPKQRVTAANGTVFFNDFNNTLHAEVNGVQEPVALNLGACNWTVSQQGEVAFLFHADGIPCLAIVDPVRHTRLIQQLRRHKLLDLLLLEDRFVAAIPGYLLSGRRGERGELCWQGMRALDCGAGFRFQVEDGRLLTYAKRGSCLRYRLDLTDGGRSAAFDQSRLWDILFRQAFAPDFRPPAPETPPENAAQLLDLFRSAAREHTVTDSGARLLALLTLLPQADLDRVGVLIALDWEMQYTGGLDEPFPTLGLLNRLLRADDPAQLAPRKLNQSQLLKWSRSFEDGTGVGRWAKPIQRVPYTDCLLTEA